MKKIIFVILFSAFLTCECLAQVTTPGLARKLRGAATLPATCQANDIYRDSDATSGQQIYLCESANTWKLQGDGGASGGDSVTVNTASDIDTTANFKDTSSVTWAVVDGGAGGPDDVQATAILANAATALAADPANCAAGSLAGGVTAAGVAEGCVDVWTEAENTAAGYTSTTDQVGTLTTGDMCTNDGSAVQCTVNTEAEFETAMDATNFIVSTEIDTFSELDAIVADKALVNKADGAAWLGVHDFGGATSVEVPQNKTASTSGQITVDDTTGQFRYGANSVERVVHPGFWTCRTLETPTDADDNIPVWAFPFAGTITKVHCYTEGGTSIAVTISDGTNALEAVTCDADGADDDGSITNGTFTAWENLEWDFAAPTGTVDWVKVCIAGTITAD